MSSPRSTPQRTCMGCRTPADKDELVRFVRGPDGGICIDYRGKLPGRGAYTHVSRDCLVEAIRRRQFGKAFREEGIRADSEELLRSLGEAIRMRILNLLGMARKSGQVMSGSNLVLESMEPGGTALILLADDISPGIAEKVCGRAERHGISYWRLFNKEIMGQVLGKGERSVVALKRGPLADSMKRELFRYKQIVGES